MFVSVGDTIGDLRFIFERRLPRRNLAKFSLRTLVCVTSIAAFFFAAAHQFQVPRREWASLALLLGTIIATGLLFRVALTDIRFPGTRRRYPARYDSHRRRQEAPTICE
jgi:hypothetical protein